MPINNNPIGCTALPLDVFYCLGSPINILDCDTICKAATQSFPLANFSNQSRNVGSVGPVQRAEPGVATPITATSTTARQQAKKVTKRRKKSHIPLCLHLILQKRINLGAE